MVNLKKLEMSILLFALTVLFVSGAAAADVPEPNAKAAILIEQSSGRVLYENNAYEPLPMASTTKIMTALIVLDKIGDLDEQVLIDERSSGIEGSSMYLEKGEVLSVEDLLYGLLLKSGNDAAAALAIHVSGSVDAFVEQMNLYAINMGLNNTHFQNPHGLPSNGHYSCAADLAKMAAKAMDNETFRKIVSTPKYQVAWGGHEWDRVMTNKNKILTLIDGGNGIKTGYTKEAGRCLVAGAKQEDMQLIAVTLNCPNDFLECANLLSWGFEEYDRLEIASRSEELLSIKHRLGKIYVCAEDEVYIPIKKGDTVSVNFDIPKSINRRIKAGERVGDMKVYVNDTLLRKLSLVSTKDVVNINIFDIMNRIMANW